MNDDDLGKQKINDLIDNKTMKRDNNLSLTSSFEELYTCKTNNNENTTKDHNDHDLESDLYASDYIVNKCVDDFYAQNLYAALCNSTWRKNEIWPILKDQSWTCSWRYAGAIIASIRKKGDYLDWYCSGSWNNLHNDNNKCRSYVGEGTVTDEIKQDLFNIGWLYINEDN